MMEMNTTSVRDYSADSSRSHSTGIVFMILLSVVASVGIFGNTLLLVIIAKFRRLRTAANCPIVSMAVCDLIICTFVIPLSICYRLNEHTFRFPAVPVMYFANTAFWNLCPILLDRYIAIKFPVWYRRRKRLRVIVAMIIVSYVVPAIGIMNVSDASPHGPKSPSLISVFFCRALPLVILVSANIATAHKIWKLSRRHRRRVQPVREAAPQMHLRDGPKFRERPNAKHSNDHPPSDVSASRSPTVAHLSGNTVSCGIGSLLVSKTGTSPDFIDVGQVPGSSGTGSPKALEQSLGGGWLLQDGLSKEGNIGLNQKTGLKFKGDDDRPKRHSQPRFQIEYFRRTKADRWQQSLGERAGIIVRGPRANGNHDIPCSRLRFNREKKGYAVTALLLLITLAFHFPLLAFLIYCRSTGQDWAGPSIEAIAQPLLRFSWCNSALDPLVYTMFIKDFRTALRNLLGRRYTV